MEIEEIKGKIERATIAIATVNSEGKPHNICIMYAKVKDGKIIISDVQMKTTINNIKNNHNVSLVFWEGEKGWRINGVVEYYDSGDWLEFVKSLEENKKDLPKGALVISIKEVIELN